MTKATKQGGTFRVHLSSGLKLDVPAQTPSAATLAALKHYPGDTATKVKLVRS